MAELRAGGYEIIEIEDEYVVYDNAAALDVGWLTDREDNHVSHF